MDLDSEILEAAKPGNKIGPYTIEQLIAKTDSSILLKAHRGLDPVAIKIPLSKDRDLIQRLKMEEAALSQLDHPNILELRDSGFFQTNQGDLPYLVAEYVKGRCFGTILKGETPKLSNVVRICLETAKALEEVHNKGIVHRDIKPNNILVGLDNRVKLADFGIAKFTRGPLQNATKMLELSPAGTPKYMSPEHIESVSDNTINVDHRTDFYGLGAILYDFITKGSTELPTDATPFRKYGVLPGLRDDFLYSPPTTPYKKILRRYQQVLKKLTAPDPNNRFQTTVEVVKALAEMLADVKLKETNQEGELTSIIKMEKKPLAIDYTRFQLMAREMPQPAWAKVVGLEVGEATLIPLFSYNHLLGIKGKSPREYDFVPQSFPRKMPNALTLGRHSKNNIIQLTCQDPSRLSRQHASLIKSEEGYFIMDNASTNGTFINGARLLKEQTYPVKHSDLVSFGTKEGVKHLCARTFVKWDDKDLYEKVRAVKS